MVEITLEIEGMACGMCEAHINDVIRDTFAVKKVNSSHSKGETHIIAETPINDRKLKEVIEKTGYKVKNIRTEPYKKTPFFLFKR